MRGKNYLNMLLIVSGAALCSIFLYNLGIDKVNVLMVFMVGVLLVTALARGYRFGIIASCISVMIFNYFFTEPYYTFLILNTNDFILMFFFLIASLISSSLTARFQRQLVISQKNEQTARLLYDVTRRLLNVTGEDNIIHQGILCIMEHTGYTCTVELHDNGKIYTSPNFRAEELCKIAELPITGLAKKLGTIKVYAQDLHQNMEQEWLFNTVAAQLGIALDREFVYNERENIRIAMEREHLKSNMLRSISHDLRTPLTGIAGASSYITEHGENLDRESILRLAGDINDQVVWLTTLVENMLNMTRIDNGSLEVNKQLEVVDDVVNEAVSHVIGLHDRSFSKILPEEIIAVPMDGKMIVQVLINLLNNAVRHTPRDCPIELSIKKSEDCVEFSVADGGAGIDPSIEGHLFEAFISSGKAGADGKKGVGLGLAICKAIVQAHGGTINAGVSRPGGALFTFTLPCREEQ